MHRAIIIFIMAMFGLLGGLPNGYNVLKNPNLIWPNIALAFTIFGTAFMIWLGIKVWRIN